MATARGAGGITVAPRGRQSKGVGSVLRIVLLGETGSGKTSGISTIPKREGTKHYFLSFDYSTWDGLVSFTKNRLGCSVDEAEAWVEENCVIYELSSPFDPSDVSTAEKVIPYMRAVIKQVKQDLADGKVATLTVEHPERLQKRIGFALVRHRNGISYGQRIPITAWTDRGALVGEFYDFVDSVKCDALILDGYGAREVDKPVGTGNFRTNKEGKQVEVTDVKKVKELPDWITKYSSQMDSKAALYVWRSREEEGEEKDRTLDDKWFCQVDFSRHPRFTIGEMRDVTGVGFAPFFEGWLIEDLKESGQIAVEASE